MCIGRTGVEEQAPPLEQDVLVKQDIRSELKPFSEPIESSQLLADLYSRG